MNCSGKLHAAQHVFRQLHMTNGFVIVASLDALHQHHAALSCSIGHPSESQHGLTPMLQLQAWRQSAASMSRLSQVNRVKSKESSQHTWGGLPSDGGPTRAVCISAIASQVGRRYAANPKAGWGEAACLHRAIELDLCCEVDCPCGAVGRCGASRQTGVCGCEGDCGCGLGKGVGGGVAGAASYSSSSWAWGCCCHWAGRSACMHGTIDESDAG